jgi:hypothetical protein
VAATTFASAIKVALDTRRAIAGLMGLRIYSVFVRQRRWSGKRVGVGTSVDNNGGPDVQLTNSLPPPLGKQPVRVRAVSNKDIIASGGLYRDLDLRVGPITPAYLASILPAGGFSDATVDPPQVGSVPTEIFWLVKGPGLPPGGSIHERIGFEETALHIYLILRAKGTQVT